MHLKLSAEQASFAASARGVLSGLREELLDGQPPHRLALADDRRVWAAAEKHGWLDMGSPEWFAHNFPFAALLMKEIGRAGILTPVADSLAAAAVMGLRTAVEVEHRGQSDGQAPMRVLALPDARVSEHLESWDGSTFAEGDRSQPEVTVSWAHQADEVILPVNLENEGSDRVGLVALAADARRPILDPRAVLDQQPLAVVALLDSNEIAWRWTDPTRGGSSLWDGLGAARLLRAWEALGHGWRAMELTASHVTTRRQFGRSLGEMEPVQQKLADMWLALESAQLLAAEASWLVANRRTFGAAAECASYACGRAAEQVTQSAVHLHGGLGYMWEYDLHWHYRRAKALRMRQGTVSRQLNGVAQQALDEIERLRGPTWALDEYEELSKL